VPSAVRSIAGFTGVHAAAAENVPVLVEYSALLRSTLGKQCPRRLLVIDLSQADALDTMIAKIRAHILEPTFRANEREIVVQRANHMKLEVAWVPGLDIGHGLIHDDDTLRRNLAVILRRGSKDYFVVKVQEPFGELDELEASEENQKEIDNEDEEPMGKDKALRRNTQGATSTERMTLGDGLVVVN
jgi:hypothetical protein